MHQPPIATMETAIYRLLAGAPIRLACGAAWCRNGSRHSLSTAGMLLARRSMATTARAAPVCLPMPQGWLPTTTPTGHPAPSGRAATAAGTPTGT